MLLDATVGGAVMVGHHFITIMSLSHGNSFIMTVLQVSSVSTEYVHCQQLQLQSQQRDVGSHTEINTYIRANL